MCSEDEDEKMASLLSFSFCFLLFKFRKIVYLSIIASAKLAKVPSISELSKSSLTTVEPLVGVLVLMFVFLGDLLWVCHHHFPGPLGCYIVDFGLDKSGKRIAMSASSL